MFASLKININLSSNLYGHVLTASSASVTTQEKINQALHGIPDLLKYDKEFHNVIFEYAKCVQIRKNNIQNLDEVAKSNCIQIIKDYTPYAPGEVGNTSSQTPINNDTTFSDKIETILDLIKTSSAAPSYFSSFFQFKPEPDVEYLLKQIGYTGDSDNYQSNLAGVNLSKTLTIYKVFCCRMLMCFKHPYNEAPGMGLLVLALSFAVFASMGTVYLLNIYHVISTPGRVWMLLMVGLSLSSLVVFTGCLVVTKQHSIFSSNQ